MKTIFDDLTTFCKKKNGNSLEKYYVIYAHTAPGSTGRLDPPFPGH
jgi:hypothetical protein